MKKKKNTVNKTPTLPSYIFSYYYYNAAVFYNYVQGTKVMFSREIIFTCTI